MFKHPKTLLLLTVLSSLTASAQNSLLGEEESLEFLQNENEVYQDEVDQELLPEMDPATPVLYEEQLLGDPEEEPKIDGASTSMVTN